MNCTVNRLQKVKLFQQKSSFSTSRVQCAQPKYIDTYNRTTVSPVNGPREGSGGIQVVSQPSCCEASAVSVWVKSGAVHEEAGEEGTANLLRAVLANSIDTEVRQLGASLTTSTCREFTHYNVQCLQDAVPKVLQVIGSAFAQPISEATVNAERASILAQQSALADTMDQRVILDHLHSAAYQQSPYARSPIGTSKGVKNASVSSLQEFRNNYYRAQSTFVSAVSSLPNPAIEQAVGAGFTSLPQTPVPFRVRQTKERPPFTGSLMHMRDDTAHVINIGIGYETFGYSHKQFATLALLKALLGEWSSTDFSGRYASPGLSEVFALENLADRFSTFSYNYNSSGLFGVYARATNEEQVDDAVYQIFNEIQKLFSRINPHDIFRAKHKVISDYLTLISTPSGNANDAAKQLATIGRRLPPQEFIERLTELKEGDVYSLIQDYFYDVDPVVVGHGPLEEFPDYALLRSWTYWNKW